MKTTLKLILLGALAVTAMACTQKTLDQKAGQVSPVFTGGVGQTKADGSYWEGDKIGIMTVGATQSSMVTDFANVGYQTTASGETTANFTVINESDKIVFENSEETVTFIAYAPYYSSEITELPGEDKDGIITGSTSSQSSADSQTALDYLYAGPRTGSEMEPQVTFKFAHVMSRLIVNISAGTGVTSDDIQEGTYTLGGLIHDGTFNLDYTDTKVGTAYATGSTTTESWNLANWCANTSDVYDASYTCILYPQTPTELPFYAKVGSTEFSDTDLSTYLEDGLEGGNSYTFNITVNESSLVVEGSTIDDWESSEDNSYDVTLGLGED